MMAGPPSFLAPQLLRSLTVLLLLPAPSEGAFGSAQVADKFDPDIVKQFLKTTRRSYALRRAAKYGKPLMVLLTKQGCGACQNLRQTVNRGTEMRGLLSDFVVCHAEGKFATEWFEKGQEGYVPQTLFFAPGESKPLPIHGTSDRQPHFFHDESTIVWGMKTAKEAVRTGARGVAPGMPTDGSDMAAGSRGRTDL